MTLISLLLSGRDMLQLAVILYPVDLSNDLFLIQHVNCNLIFRNNQEPSLLDLVFITDDSFIDNIDVFAPREE